MIKETIRGYYCSLTEAMEDVRKSAEYIREVLATSYNFNLPETGEDGSREVYFPRKFVDLIKKGKKPKIEKIVAEEAAIA